MLNVQLIIEALDLDIFIFDYSSSLFDEDNDKEP